MGNKLVLDTNIVLDMFVFDDPEGRRLRESILANEYLWLSTKAMRSELARVLDYPHIAVRKEFYKLSNEAVLAKFDELAHLRETAVKAPCTCKDPDDQIYIDLAYAQNAMLLSKDKAVLALKGRLKKLGIVVATALSTMPELATTSEPSLNTLQVP